MNPVNEHDSLLGRTLGRFEIVRELGRGAMGIVYEARDPAIGRRVAIKTVKTGPAGDVAAELLERFRREASAAGTLSHQNIVTVYDVGEQDGVVYIAMEFLEGQPLDKILDARRCLPVEECVELVAQVLDGLGHAHEHGVVHRDVKPANIVVNKDGQVKVADFGIAHTVDSTLTRTGVLIGTPNYMSPEQFAAGHIDGRSDLFSTAVILYELLTGEKAFHGENLSTMMHNVMNAEPVPVRKVNLHVPETLAAVLEKAMSKDPRRRYQTAREFAAALRESVKESPDASVLQLDTAAATATTRTVVSSAETVVARPQTGPSDETAPAAVASATAAGVPESAPSGRFSRILLVFMVGLLAVVLAVASYIYSQTTGQDDTTSGTIVEPGVTKPFPDPITFRVRTQELDLDSLTNVALEGVSVCISGGGFGETRMKIGTTPLIGTEITVAGGKYLLEFKRTGFETQEVQADLQPGDVFEQLVTMLRTADTSGGPD